MLTDLEKQKIAILRSRFTDDEWEQLKTSDDYARERIAFYSSREIESTAMALKGLKSQQEMLDKQTASINDKVNLLKE